LTTANADRIETLRVEHRPDRAILIFQSIIVPQCLAVSVNPATPRRRIAHLDMDAFFASVELLRYPELRGLPVVIGGRGSAPERLPDGRLRTLRLRDYVGRGVLTTSTYEARRYGVFSAMGIMKAAQLAPDAV